MPSGKTQSVLVVEDEASIASFVALYLRNAGYEVRTAATGAEALSQTASGDVSLIILDLMLPDIDGIDVCRRIRQRSEVPILMLTARDEDVDKIIGLEVGADDYLTKPFNPRELVARVKSILPDISACVTITARTGDDEISNIIVPNGTPGYEISAPMHKLGWHASDTRELSFRDVAVPEGNLLGPRGEGFRQFLEILDGGRISVAAMGVGLAQGAYDQAFAYAQQREQFGKLIARFQAVQFKLADMATEIEAGRNLVYRAAWLKDQGRPFAREAAMAKLYTGEMSNRAVNSSLQIHGGYGYTEEFPIARFYRDQKILEIGEGTNEVQRMVIARHLGL
jgi:CheY-like chemotaxis protein